ncbi:glycerate kinase family protein [Ilumatobacter coccineus]|uniref:Glycerate kinase n=1 Tax=Ilumatobacter coccineus (strain NBRC 103263 / KCTC 29153 / YM16-304) TaxID=1313172 RepID=A0A6C7E357_ILUCY|nr:glycerate kinase [Ilumatobacter coccineus]BAN00802.1 glycerate kinase [Ilumatobacter coccineus YM16-304]
MKRAGQIKRVLAAPDKFKGTATAAEVAAAIGHACWEVGIDVVELPMADGGDGILDVLGGANRTTKVTGPLGDIVDAEWRMRGETAVIEMARASGLVLAGGAEGNDPLGATTTGTGELIDHALDSGAKRIIVGLGGSATTDGGFGAIRAITAIARIKQVELLVACDVTTRFTDAAAVFGPQKGATPAQVKLLERRLDRLVQMFADDFDIDVTEIDGGGAAGGLGGALAALGGRLVPGVELIGEEVGLFDLLEDGDPPDLIITGEGRLDRTSLAGKVVGELLTLGEEHGIPVAVIAGEIDDDVADEISERADVVSLTELVGREAAFAEPKRHIETAARHLLEAHLTRS